MRVVAGEFGGRRLKAVPGMNTRPTTDKVKESMFNIIGPYLNGGNVLDLFGGSGGLSIEAVSRGADSATLIDRQYQAIKTINENIEVTKSKEKFRIIKGDTNKVIFKLAKESKRFDYVFLDPPYKKQEIVKLLGEIFELDQEANLPEELTGYEFIKKSDYGITELTFYRYLGGEQHEGHISGNV